jgi:hypothetical protein
MRRWYGLGYGHKGEGLTRGCRMAHRDKGWEGERSTGARGGVVRSSAVERIAAWEWESTEVRNSLTHPKHAP